jgi:hypothetical protein
VTFLVSLKTLPGYVRCDVRGQASLKSFTSLLEGAAKATEAVRGARVLLDLRGVSGRLSFTEQFLLGELVAEKLPHLGRVASLVPPDDIPRNAERVATRSGLLISVFTSEPEAISWLTEIVTSQPAARAAKSCSKNFA